ncbi:MAG: hypothetical protein B7Y33_05635 [Hydrogenophilales bacterium 16-62-9]|nr:MAG: hypothetical protein B7Y33_05635 [Hydrogenophilales bacterium 16-62-9]
MAAYVLHRLHVAGCDKSVFSPWAMWALSRASRGLPRLINIIAAKSMMLAYGRGAQRVTYRHVAAASRDTLAARKHGAASRFWIGALLGLATAAAAAFMGVWRSGGQ